MKKNKKLINRRAFVTSGLIVGGTSLLLSCKEKNENLVTTETKKRKIFITLKW